MFRSFAGAKFYTEVDQSLLTTTAVGGRIQTSRIFEASGVSELQRERDISSIPPTNPTKTTAPYVTYRAAEYGRPHNPFDAPGIRQPSASIIYKESVGGSRTLQG